jgi:hypothetical protein
VLLVVLVPDVPVLVPDEVALDVVPEPVLELAEDAEVECVPDPVLELADDAVLECVPVEPVVLAPLDEVEVEVEVEVAVEPVLPALECDPVLPAVLPAAVLAAVPPVEPELQPAARQIHNSTGPSHRRIQTSFSNEQTKTTLSHLTISLMLCRVRSRDIDVDEVATAREVEQAPRFHYQDEETWPALEDVARGPLQANEPGGSRAATSALHLVMASQRRGGVDGRRGSLGFGE